jgi:thiamine-monophosphate kinase
MNEADVVTAIRRVFRAAGVATEDDDDDTARIDELLTTHVTTDVTVEDVDFARSLYPLRYAGLRSLAQNVSDLFAADAEPTALLWSLSIPPTWSLVDVERFSTGAAQLAGALGMRLLGGDLSRTAGPFQCAITAFGRAPQLSTTRKGARVGQGLWLTRALGGSAVGLRLLQQAQIGDDEAAFSSWRSRLTVQEQRAVACHVEPSPVHGLERLTDFAVAAIDISDGLAIDAGRLARSSGVAVEFDHLDDAVDHRAGATAEDALRGGEDWAILFAVPDGLEPEGCIRVGTVVAGPAGRVTVDGVVVTGGHDHFER